MASLGRTCVATASSWSEYLSAKGLPTIPPPAEAALKLAACTVRSVVADASALVFATWERASVTSPLGAVLMVAMLLAAAGLANASKWLLFLVVSFVLSLLQQIWATWQFVRISSGLVIIGALKAGMLIYEAYRTAALSVLAVASRRAGSRRQRKRAVAFASSYAAYAEAACAASGDAPGPADGPAEPLLRATVGDLVAARESGDPQRLRFALSAVLKRNHLGIENEENVAHLAVASFRAEVMRSLDALAANEASSPTDRLRFFRRQQHALGGTALCLSGGGSLTSYHIGVLKGLIESKLLSKIKVFSGTSGGSIMAAMVASRTEQELTEFVLVPSFGGDFRQDGTQTSEFVFFPSLREQLVSFLRYRRLVPSGHFSRACKWYVGRVLPLLILLPSLLTNSPRLSQVLGRCDVRGGLRENRAPRVHHGVRSEHRGEQGRPAAAPAQPHLHAARDAGLGRGRLVRAPGHHGFADSRGACGQPARERGARDGQKYTFNSGRGGGAAKRCRCKTMTIICRLVA